MAWVERIVPNDQDDQFESWRKEFQQERMIRIVREREIMKETAKRCKSYKAREQEANEAIERKRQAILAQRKAATVQATMRFQRNLPGFTVMDPQKFDRAIETITGRQLSNRSTPRRPSNYPPQQVQSRTNSNNTFRRSISMEDFRTRVPMETFHQQNPPTHLTRTNSTTQIQYKSPLHEVQRRVLNDFAAEIHSTLRPEENERGSVDSLEESAEQMFVQPKVMGPIVRPQPVLELPSRRTETSTIVDDPRRSYHESFFVKNSPVTGDEQVTAWLGAQQTSSDDGKQTKSILKRSPSVESCPSKIKMTPQKTNPNQIRTVGDKNKVKDSLEVINAKLLKDLDIQKKTVRFATDSSNERCASDTRLVHPEDQENQQTPIRRVQSATLMPPEIRPRPSKQTNLHDDRASECSSTTSSKPPIYPLTPTGHQRHGYSSIGIKQRELRAKLHKTRYAQSLRQTNTSPSPSDSASARGKSPMTKMPIDDEEENGSIFSELRMSSDARLPPPVPSKSNATIKTTIPSTTLSIEERRVQESLDRLDRQLKEVQSRSRSKNNK